MASDSGAEGRTCKEENECEAGIKTVKNPRASFSRRLIVAVTFPTVLGFTLLMRGQEAQRLGGPALSRNTPARRSRGVPWDWTHHHVIFSHPGTAARALQNGTYDRWLKIASDPRYVIQQLRRSRAGLVLPDASQAPPAEVGPGLAPDLTDEADAAGEAAAPMTEEEFPGGALPRGLARALIPPPAQHSGLLWEPPEAAARRPPAKKKNRFHKDWSETEGNNGTTGLGVFPATFTSTSASCTTDFAVFNTGLAGSSSQASIIAFNKLYSSCAGSPATYWAFNTSGTIVTSVVLSLDGTQVAFVQTDNATGYADLVLLKWKASNDLELSHDEFDAALCALTAAAPRDKLLEGNALKQKISTILPKCGTVWAAPKRYRLLKTRPVSVTIGARSFQDTGVVPFLNGLDGK